MSNAVIPVHAEIPPPQVQEVSDGIFAYIQLDGSWYLNNAGAIIGKNAVTVVDTTSTEARARALHASLRRITDKPASVLINTHSHGDHTYGNFMFAPETAIIAHERCREDVIAAGPARRSAMVPSVEFGDCPLTPPFVTFQDRMNVYVDDLKVELIYVAPAHTTSDIIAWIPERKLLFSGDIIFNGGTPFALMGSVAGWLETLDLLESLGAETIVPGHGSVCGPEVIEDIRDYLHWIQQLAKQGSEAGIEPLELARQTDLGRFSTLHDVERIVPNLHRAYAELRGEPRGARMDLGKMIGEMLEYNGGQPLRCFA
jgi:cyclase